MGRPVAAPFCVWMKFFWGVFGYALKIVYLTYEKECSFLVARQETNQRNVPRTDEPTVRRLGSTTPSFAPVVPRSGTPRARKVGYSQRLVALRRDGRKCGKVPHSRILSGERAGEKNSACDWLTPRSLCLRAKDCKGGGYEKGVVFWGHIFFRMPLSFPTSLRPAVPSARAAVPRLWGEVTPRFPRRDSRPSRSGEVATISSRGHKAPRTTDLPRPWSTASRYDGRKRGSGDSQEANRRFVLLRGALL